MRPKNSAAAGGGKPPAAAVPVASLTVLIYGIPAPQGSKRSFKSKTGAVVMVESGHERVRAWRDAVRSDVRDAISVSKLRPPIEGPICVEVVFTLNKPLYLGAKPARPDKRPDLDKLIRSTLDGLTASGVIRDDSQVVRVVAEKTYPDGHPNALPTAGAWMKLGTL